MSALAVKPRFSGHETFACRFTWLPKAVRLIARDPAALVSDDAAILELGLGKNMVRSLRFWLDAFGVASLVNGEWRLAPFGFAVLSEKGLDPFIERIETQWLLHWHLATRVDAPLFAWRHVFHRRMRSDFTRAELLEEMRAEGRREGYDHSDVTLLQHIDALLHTYLGGQVSTAPEDALDGPLVDLGLLVCDGRRRGGGARAEAVYALARIPLTDIGRPVLDYAIDDFWQKRRSSEATVTFRELAHGEGSPGSTLRLLEDELRAHVESGSGKEWAYRASGDAGSLTRTAPIDPSSRLKEIYR